MIKQKLAIQLLLAIPAAVLNARGAQPSSITISSSTNPSIFGQAVPLPATVSPSPTGIVTFYDGTTVLGTKTLASGKATLTTSLLPSGARFLKAYYGGNDTYAASTSAGLAGTVSTLSASGQLRYRQRSHICGGRRLQWRRQGGSRGRQRLQRLRKHLIGQRRWNLPICC